MQGKKPTREQRKFIERYGLNSDNWLVQKDTSTYMQLVQRVTDKVQTIHKEL